MAMVVIVVTPPDPIKSHNEMSCLIKPANTRPANANLPKSIKILPISDFIFCCFDTTKIQKKYEITKFIVC